MTELPSARTRLVALLGDPVHHSLSPRFQNAAFRTAGLDAVYLALRCNTAELPGLLRGIAAAGGAGNVTVPHKEAAAQAVDCRTEAAERTGACNTFWLDNNRICGDNTDVQGFAMAVRALLGRSAAGLRVLLVGAGGAARAALASVVAEQAAEVVLVNRSRERATELAARFAGDLTEIRVSALPQVEDECFDLLVNATSLGLRPDDPLPLPLTPGPRAAAALDLVYRRGETAWVRQLREAGIPAADGTQMLLHQGAAAFERWWGQPAPLEAMRAALSAAE